MKIAFVGLLLAGIAGGVYADICADDYCNGKAKDKKCQWPSGSTWQTCDYWCNKSNCKTSKYLECSADLCDNEKLSKICINPITNQRSTCREFSNPPSQ